MLQNKTLRNERVRSSRIKQNRGRYCVDRERTEYDVWGILCLLLGHMVQVTLLVIVVGVEVVTLGGWIISTIVRLGGRVPRLWALFGIVPFFSTSVTSNAGAIGEFFVSCMIILGWA